MANITIDTSAKLNLDMEAMTSTTKAKYDVFNTKYKQILENDNALNTSIQEATDSVNKSITDLKTTTENSIQELEESVDDKFEQRKKSISVTIPSSGWSDSVPYTQTVAVSNITESTVLTGVLDTRSCALESSEKAMKKAYNCLSYFETGENSIKATAKFVKPEADIVLALREV